MNTPFFVAEISCNHLGDFDRAMSLVEAAARAGATHVKTQCFDPFQMANQGVKIKSGPWAGRELLDLYKEAATPMDWHEPLFKRARELGMEGFASVFHCDDVDHMEAIGCPMYKISSFEILDWQLISKATFTDKPLILSTGMATMKEIAQASAAASGCRDITLLKCTSAYPATAADANLAAGQAMGGWTFGRVAHGVKWGVSDHTLGLGVAAAAATLGATMIEKHLTLRRSDGGPDAAFSSEPEEFATMVKACHEAAEAIGEVKYGPTPSEESSLQFRRPPGGKRGA